MTTNRLYNKGDLIFYYSKSLNTFILCQIETISSPWSSTMGIRSIPDNQYHPLMFINEFISVDSPVLLPRGINYGSLWFRDQLRNKLAK